MLDVSKNVNVLFYVINASQSYMSVGNSQRSAAAVLSLTHTRTHTCTCTCTCQLRWQLEAVIALQLHLKILNVPQSRGLKDFIWFPLRPLLEYVPVHFVTIYNVLWQATNQLLRCTYSTASCRATPGRNDLTGRVRNTYSASRRGGNFSHGRILHRVSRIKPGELEGIGTVQSLPGLTMTAERHRSLKHSRDTEKFGNAAQEGPSSPHPLWIPNESVSLLPKFKWMISVTHIYFMRLMGPIKLWLEILLGGFYMRVAARRAGPGLALINGAQTIMLHVIFLVSVYRKNIQYIDIQIRLMSSSISQTANAFSMLLFRGGRTL